MAHSAAACRFCFSIHNLMTNEKYRSGQSEAVFPTRLRFYFSTQPIAIPHGNLAKCGLRLADVQRLQCLVIQLPGDRQLVYRLKPAYGFLRFWTYDAID
jgi:hypothetical protein